MYIYQYYTLRFIYVYRSICMCIFFTKTNFSSCPKLGEKTNAQATLTYSIFYLGDKSNWREWESSHLWRTKSAKSWTSVSVRSLPLRRDCERGCPRGRWWRQTSGRRTTARTSTESTLNLLSSSQASQSYRGPTCLYTNSEKFVKNAHLITKIF